MDEREEDQLFAENERILLLEEPKVYLIRWDHPALEDRLASLFPRAWSMLLTAAREAIARHWVPSKGYPIERIVIKDLGYEEQDLVINGSTEREGHRIEFDERAVRHLPDRPLIGVILHELTHVYGHAIGEEHHVNLHDAVENRQKCEEFVHARMASWGLSKYETEGAEWLLDKDNARRFAEGN